MRFLPLDANKASAPIDRMCVLLNVIVSGYYAWRLRGASRRQLDDTVLLAHIRSQFALSNAIYGSPRMHAELCDEGVRAGRYRAARLMRDNGLKALQKRRWKKTTDSRHGRPVAPNLLDQDFTCEGPNQKWGCDISYVWTIEGWLYLAIVLDLYSRRIVGWAVSDRPSRPAVNIVLRGEAGLMTASPLCKPRQKALAIRGESIDDNAIYCIL